MLGWMFFPVFPHIVNSRSMIMAISGMNVISVKDSKLGKRICLQIL